MQLTSPMTGCMSLAVTGLFRETSFVPAGTKNAPRGLPGIFSRLGLLMFRGVPMNIGLGTWSLGSSLPCSWAGTAWAEASMPANADMASTKTTVLFILKAPLSEDPILLQNRVSGERKITGEISGRDYFPVEDEAFLFGGDEEGPDVRVLLAVAARLLGAHGQEGRGQGIGHRRGRVGHPGGQMPFRRTARPGIVHVPALDLGSGPAKSASMKQYALGHTPQFPDPTHADGPAGLVLAQAGGIARRQGSARASRDKEALNAPIREDRSGSVQRIALAHGPEVEVESVRRTLQEILPEPDAESRTGGGPLEFRPLRRPF